MRSLDQLVDFLGDRALSVHGDTSIEVEGFAPAIPGRVGAISFIIGRSRDALQVIDSSASSAFLVPPGVVSSGDCAKAVIEVSSPRLEFARLGHEFFPVETFSNSEGIHPNASVGVGTVIGPGTIVESGVAIGRHCAIGPNVVITHTRVGDNCIIERNTSIGQDGFGYFRHGDIVLKVKQIGGVVIGNNVEIGANCSIDRGTIDNTVIGDYSKLDNQIQIAHNVILGEGAIMAGASAIAGSTTVGKHVTIAGQAGLVGHITIGDYVTIAAKAGVTKNVEDKKIVAGYPATDINTWKKECIALKKLIKKKK